MKNKGLLIGIIGGGIAALGAMIAGAALYIRKHRKPIIFADLDDCDEEFCFDIDEFEDQADVLEEDVEETSDAEETPTYKKILNIGVEDRYKKGSKNKSVKE